MLQSWIGSTDRSPVRLSGHTTRLRGAAAAFHVKPDAAAEGVPRSGSEGRLALSPEWRRTRLGAEAEGKAAHVSRETGHRQERMTSAQMQEIGTP